MRIEDEIQQKEFQSEYHKLTINLLFTASWLKAAHAEALKPYNISLQQFNILRILRGRYPETATVKILTSKMIDKMSNASRLVEKLQKKGLIERKTDKADRRQVNIIITEQGLALVQAASDSIAQSVDHQLKSLSCEQAKTLNRLLDELRS